MCADRRDSYLRRAWPVAAVALMFLVLPARAVAGPEYGRFLASFVHDEGIDYEQALRSGGKELLEAFLKELAAAKSGDLVGDKGMALLINAYNACTLKLILDNYPLASIRDLKKPWGREVWDIAGTKYSLDRIEKELLLKNFQEARIHFGLNCASLGCPPLAAVPYTEANVHAALEEGARKFLNNPAYSRYEIVQKSGQGSDKVLKLRLSKIFSWYKKDFVHTYGSLQTMLTRYLPAECRLYLESGNYDIDFEKYGWELNRYTPK